MASNWNFCRTSQHELIILNLLLPQLLACCFPVYNTIHLYECKVLDSDIIYKFLELLQNCFTNIVAHMYNVYDMICHTATHIIIPSHFLQLTMFLYFSFVDYSYISKMNITFMFWRPCKVYLQWFTICSQE